MKILFLTALLVVGAFGYSLVEMEDTNDTYELDDSDMAELAEITDALPTHPAATTAGGDYVDLFGTVKDESTLAPSKAQEAATCVPQVVDKCPIYMAVYKTINPTLMRYPQKERYCQNPKVLSAHKEGCGCEPTQTCKEFANDHQFEMMYETSTGAGMRWVTSCTNVIKLPSRTSKYDYTYRRYIYTQPPRRNFTTYWNDDEWLSSNLPNIGRYSSYWKHPMKCCCEWLRMHMNNEFSFLKDRVNTNSASLYNANCKNSGP